MSWGSDNLDGWGYVYVADHGEVHHRSSAPLTADEQARQQLSGVSARHFLVHVRQKTPGSATAVVNTAPFSDPSGYYFSHNGYVTGFRDGVRDELLGKLSDTRAAGLAGDTDSEVLFALVLDQLDAGAPPVEATRVVADVAERYGGRYNVVLWHPNGFVATRWDNSLYLATDSGTFVSSEPIGDREWRAVPERTVVVCDHTGWQQEAW
jgi:predicted glutamine amidotransferase